MSHRISFIVPTFNRALYLDEALAAILAEAGPDDEILVVDDGSTDRTAELVAALAPRVRYIRQENSGKSAALNRGLANTDGEFVWICDDDDILLPGAAKALLAGLDDPAADFSFGRYYPFRAGAGGHMDRLPFHWPDLGIGSVARHLLEDAFIMQNAALVRRRLYGQVGPFDVQMLRSLDYEMFVRLALAGRAVFVDREIFAQRKHEGARGPTQMRHDPGKSENVWLEFDQRIFRRLNQDQPVAIYQAMFESDEPELLARAGFLQRACVSVRHGLWDLAAADLWSASLCLADRPLDPAEKAICARALCGKYELANANASDVQALIRGLFGSGGRAREAVLAMLGGGLWRFRRRQGTDVGDYLSLVRGTIGLKSLPGLLWAKARQAAGPSSVSERSELAGRFLLAPPAPG